MQKRLFPILNWIVFFEDVVGSHLDNTRKDKTEIIKFLIREFGIKREETLMIGDRKYDIIGAKNNALRSIGVSYDHGSSDELQEVGADFIASSCLELLDSVKNELAYNNSLSVKGREHEQHLINKRANTH